jgi:ATP-dependent protease ClpP protease subunit
VITPDPYFRPNPNRAIYVQGVFNQEMVDRLTPQILTLKSQSRDPITAYIDSPGGNVALMEALLGLLTASDQDFNESWSLITVVTTRAASAGAEMLSSGDYALAYPTSTVLYHGARIPEFQEPLTAEWSSLLAQFLKESDDAYAMGLARKIVNRAMFRFVMAKQGFERVRSENPSKQMSDLECFLALTSEELSPKARRVLHNARARHARYEDLLEHINKKKSTAKTKAGREAFRIKQIIEFELRKNRSRADWSFENGGLNTISDDFFLLNEYLANYRSGFFKAICLKYGNYVLGEDDKKYIGEAATDEESKERKISKAGPLLMPIWSFVFAMCHALQHGDNDLTSKDAFRLGLIDEVIGEQRLFALRMASEYEPDPEPEEKKDDETEREEAATAGATAGADAARPEA